MYERNKSAEQTLNRFTVIIKQLKQHWSNQKKTDTKTAVVVVRESHIGPQELKLT